MDKDELERLRAEIAAGLVRAFGWRYRWVRRTPDLAAAWAALADRLASWTPLGRWTRMGGEGGSVGFGR